MKTATSLNLLYDPTFKLDVCEQLRRVNAAGFDTIDVNFWDWGHDAASPFMQDNWMDWVKRIGECGKELGVHFHQAHAMVYDPFRENPKNEFLAEATRRSVIGAGILGIDWIVFHASRPLADDEPLDEILARNHEFLDPYVKLAKDNNTGMALENMRKSDTAYVFPSDAEQLCTLVDSFDADNVGICWDVGHAHCSKLNQYDEIKKLAHRLKVLHVQDSNGIQDQHTAPFYGTVNWKDVKRGLNEIGYKGEFTFEAHMIVRYAPDAISKNAAIRLLYLIGEHIINMEV